jgi:glycosyl transferase family 2
MEPQESSCSLPGVRAVTSSGAAVPEAASQFEDHLRVGLDVPLPGELAIGKGTALFVCGTCFHRDARIRSLAFVLDGVEQAVAAHSMPRLDYFASLHPGVDPNASRTLRSDPASEDDPPMHSYRSGFWGIVRVGPRTGESCELGLRARLVGGGEATAALARLRLTTLPRRPTVVELEPGAGPLVAICMASYEPPMDLFRRQLESIRSQTHRNWVCVISDDCSSPKSFATIQREVGDDPRFVVSRSPRRLGFYLNFERALTLSARNADYIALADQDDRWYPEKLEATCLQRRACDQPRRRGALADLLEQTS